MSKIKLQIFSDYAWPFCYIGKGIVEKLKQEYPLDDEWINYELHPETPASGIKIEDLLPGVDLKAMHLNLEKHGRQYGINFAANEFLPNTKMALEASEFARENNKFHEFHDRIFQAYFSEGKNIGNLMVILEVAKDIGLDSENLEEALIKHTYAAKVEENKKLSQENWITGIPTFISPDGCRIVGAQSYTSFKNTFDEIISRVNHCSNSNHS